MIDTETIKTEAQIRKEELEQFVGECAQLLTLPATCDKSDILTAIKRQVRDQEEKNEDLESRLNKEQIEHDRQVNDLLDEVAKLKVITEKQDKRIIKEKVEHDAKLELLQKENDTLKIRVERLEQGVSLVIQEKQKTITWLERITGTIRKIKLLETL